MYRQLVYTFIFLKSTEKCYHVVIVKIAAAVLSIKNGVINIKFLNYDII